MSGADGAASQGGGEDAGSGVDGDGRASMPASTPTRDSSTSSSDGGPGDAGKASSTFRLDSHVSVLGDDEAPSDVGVAAMRAALHRAQQGAGEPGAAAAGSGSAPSLAASSVASGSGAQARRLALAVQRRRRQLPLIGGVEFARKWQDAGWAVVFLVIFAAWVGAGVYSMTQVTGIECMRNRMNKENAVDQFDEMLSVWEMGVGYCAAAALVFCVLWLVLLRVYPRSLIYISAWLGVLGLAGAGVYFFMLEQASPDHDDGHADARGDALASGSRSGSGESHHAMSESVLYPLSAFFVVAAVAVAIYVSLSRMKIIMTEKAMDEASLLLGHNARMPLVFFVLFLTEVTVSWGGLAFVIATFIIVESPYGDKQCLGAYEHVPAWVWPTRAFVIMAFLWARGVVRQMRSAVVCGASAIAFFHSTDPGYAASNLLTKPLGWSMTKSLGTAAKGGFLTSPMVTVPTCYCCCCCGCGGCDDATPADFFRWRSRAAAAAAAAAGRPLLHPDALGGRSQRGCLARCCCCPFAWVRPLFFVEKMVWASAAASGDSLLKAAAHTNFLLANTNLWGWSMVITNFATFVFRSFSTVVGLVAGMACAFMLRARLQGLTSQTLAVIDSRALWLTGGAIAAFAAYVVVDFVTALLLNMLHTVVMCYAVDRQEAQLRAATRGFGASAGSTDDGSSGHLQMAVQGSREALPSEPQPLAGVVPHPAAAGGAWAETGALLALRASLSSLPAAGLHEGAAGDGEGEDGGGGGSRAAAAAEGKEGAAELGISQ